MQPLPRPQKPHPERDYSPSEPGYALQSYLFNARVAMWECAGDLDDAEVERPGTTAEHRRDILKIRLGLLRRRFAPNLSACATSLANAAEKLRLGSAFKGPLTESCRSLTALWEALPNDPPPAAGGAKAEPVTLPEPDPVQIRRLIANATGPLDALEAFWSRFDPAKERVDRAMVPWERAYELAIQINDATCELIQHTEADSLERIRGSEQITTWTEQDLTRHWTGAVQHALNEDLATRINAAFLLVRDSSREATANAIRMRRRGDATWPEVWGRLNSAVLAMQDLRPLLRRAVVTLRAGAEPAEGNPGERPPASSKSYVKRVVRDAVRREHGGYVDDAVIVAAVRGGLSYRKAATALSQQLGREVTKRQVEEAVKRAGGLKAIGGEGSGIVSRDDLD